ncbi:hypothetical protein COEREDRAFT_82107 [Coemansia reversa NRRL 1564]|uniref:Sugar transporter SWEET n=1 Tax=Coemansia reversa (strain ATCC 12441 / NRRL 1564) TaxID=763665 RepID=A0A2G5B8M3_COERN|nr:hypothetical protein COEREDRAFT_82107 [Coemansia reversa NRRL 1564]|eukprot:PIA15359.1 hypothetical protein COEREDRAFT_82107 [Coemansia reversa NRRL 1564]
MGMFISQLTVIGELRRAQVSKTQVPILQTLASFLSCILWFKYGLIKHDTTVSLVNGVGTMVTMYILGCFWVYDSSPRRVESGVLVASIISVSLVGYVDYAKDVWSLELYSMICCLMSLVFLGSPLGHIGKVVESRDASVLLPSVAALALANNMLWCVYGVMREDPYMFVPNIIGSSFCALQLALVAYYGRAIAEKSKELAALDDNMAHLI